MHIAYTASKKFWAQPSFKNRQLCKIKMKNDQVDNFLFPRKKSLLIAGIDSVSLSCTIGDFKKESWAHKFGRWKTFGGSVGPRKHTIWGFLKFPPLK